MKSLDIKKLLLLQSSLMDQKDRILNKNKRIECILLHAEGIKVVNVRLKNDISK